MKIPVKLNDECGFLEKIHCSDPNVNQRFLPGISFQNFIFSSLSRVTNIRNPSRKILRLVPALFCAGVVCSTLTSCADLEPIYDSTGFRLEDDHRIIALKALDKGWQNGAKKLNLPEYTIFYHGQAIRDDAASTGSSGNGTAGTGAVKFNRDGVHVDATKTTTLSNWSGTIRGEIVVVSGGMIMVGSDLMIRNGAMNFGASGSASTFLFERGTHGNVKLKRLRLADVEGALRDIASR